MSKVNQTHALIEKEQIVYLQSEMYVTQLLLVTHHLHLCQGFKDRFVVWIRDAGHLQQSVHWQNFIVLQGFHIWQYCQQLRLDAELHALLQRAHCYHTCDRLSVIQWLVSVSLVFQQALIITLRPRTGNCWTSSLMWQNTCKHYQQISGMRRERDELDVTQ